MIIYRLIALLVGRVRVRALLGTAQLGDLVASVDPTRDFAGLDDLVG